MNPFLAGTGSFQLLTGMLTATSIGGGLLLISGPSPERTNPLAQASVTLPATGGSGLTTRTKVWHEPEPLEPSEMVYARYVPPPPVPPLAPTAPTAPYVTIPVPIYRQAMNLDCETSALRMGLAAYGSYYSDSALFAAEIPDLRSPVLAPNHTVLQWGDPYTNFVGNVNGSDLAPTGYGIYYPPIVSIARSHGLPNTVGGEGFAPSTIYNALLSGHPVEVWVETGWVRPAVGTWTAWDGRPVRYSLVEHAVTLSGVSPSGVRVNDPLFGTQYWVSKATFETVWADFNNMAVIFQ